VIYRYSDAVIIVFCKAPIAGQVKTRLMPQLSADQAAQVHRELTIRVLSMLSAAKLCPIQLWCSPDTTDPFFTECAEQYELSLHQQLGDDLGERMHNAISVSLVQSNRVLLIGCDCPSLTVDDVNSALYQLQHDRDVVFSPAEDGGYVMVGMKKAQASLFMNMTWGHQNVLSTSYERAEKAELNLIETRKHWDVDTFKDLQRYREL